MSNIRGFHTYTYSCANVEHCDSDWFEFFFLFFLFLRNRMFFLSFSVPSRSSCIWGAVTIQVDCFPLTIFFCNYRYIILRFMYLKGNANLIFGSLCSLNIPLLLYTITTCKFTLYTRKTIPRFFVFSLLFLANKL